MNKKKFSDPEIKMMQSMRNNLCLVFTDEATKWDRAEKLMGLGLCYQKHIDDGELGGAPLSEFFLTSAGEEELRMVEAEQIKKSLNIVSPTMDLMKFAVAMKADLERREMPTRSTDEIYARNEADDY